MMRDKIAAELWRVEAVDAGVPESVAKGRTPEAFADQSPELRVRWFKFANAILAALPGMIPDLVWKRADLSCWGETAKNGMGGSYRMTWEFGVGPNGEDTFFTVQFNSIGLYSGWSFDADIAMAAANTHHRAAIAKSAGWTT